MTEIGILITGGTGLIGKALVKKIAAEGRKVYVTTRNTSAAEKRSDGNVRYVEWSGRGIIENTDILRNIKCVVHLMGAGIGDQRWTRKYKEEILRSRVDSTKNLLLSFKKCGSMPEIVACSSATGYYGSRGDDILLENSTSGEGFLANVCSLWEDAAREFIREGCQCTIVRTGVVLSAMGGALPRMLLPYRFFMGGPIGSGRQWFSWVHIDDLARIYAEALTGRLPEIINGTAPEPVRMREFAAVIGRRMKRPAFFKVPLPILRLAVGEAAYDLAASQRVFPDALLKSNFKFQFNDITAAIADLI